MKSTVKIILFISLFFLAASLLIFPVIDKHYDNENGMKNIVINRISIDAQRSADMGEKYEADIAKLRDEYGSRHVPDRVEYIDIMQAGETDERYMQEVPASEKRDRWRT